MARPCVECLAFKTGDLMRDYDDETAQAGHIGHCKDRCQLKFAYREEHRGRVGTLWPTRKNGPPS